MISLICCREGFKKSAKTAASACAPGKAVGLIILNDSNGVFAEARRMPHSVFIKIYAAQANSNSAVTLNHRKIPPRRQNQSRGYLFKLAQQG